VSDEGVETNETSAEETPNGKTDDCEKAVNEETAMETDAVSENTTET
jgi:hypothetical protein